jgi:hypothetical protein
MSRAEVQDELIERHRANRIGTVYLKTGHWHVQITSFYAWP